MKVFFSRDIKGRLFLLMLSENNLSKSSDPQPDPVTTGPDPQHYNLLKLRKTWVYYREKKHLQGMYIKQRVCIYIVKMW